MVAPVTSTVTGPALVTCVVGLVGEQPEAELSFGARVEVVTTGELSDPDFRANPTDPAALCTTT
jgi:hypothetical protein